MISTGQEGLVTFLVAGAIIAVRYNRKKKLINSGNMEPYCRREELAKRVARDIAHHTMPSSWDPHRMTKNESA